MKPGLSLRVSQHLSLTPQLQQSIQLLQLSSLEMEQEVEQMLDDNPFLERASDEAEREAFGLEQADTPAAPDEYALHEALLAGGESMGASASGAADSMVDAAQSDTPPADAAPDWEGDGQTALAPDDSEWGGDAPTRGPAPHNDDEPDAADLAHSHESLSAHLHRQALSLRLDAVDAAALRFLIESLNDDGYLEETLEQLASSLAGDDLEQQEELVHRFTVARGLLQSLEPTGVGAHDLAQCLQLQVAEALKQAMARQASESELAVLHTARCICAQPLELLAKRDLRRLASLCAAREDRLRDAISLIGRLEPKPGRRFVDVQRNVVVPDVIVRAAHSRSGRQDFVVQLNPEVMPRLRVHDIYAGALRSHRGSEGHAALQQRLQEARWFIKNIQQRFDTILRVSQAIVERQRNFFVHGELAMRPLVLRDIADALGLHESTISRVTTAKYMATPQGTYELKYFFGSGLGTETGGSASSTAVRALIKQFVAAEDPHKPLSDSQLAEMLKEQGIECARRTVAKYRELLKIPVTALRRTL